MTSPVIKGDIPERVAREPQEPLILSRLQRLLIDVAEEVGHNVIEQKYVRNCAQASANCIKQQAEHINKLLGIKDSQGQGDRVQERPAFIAGWKGGLAAGNTDEEQAWQEYRCQDLTRQPDPVVQALRVRVDETVRAEVRMKSRIKVLEASEDRLCISANDRAANTCKLASAALSHLAASAQADPNGPNPYIHHDSPSSWREHSNCIQAAIDLLKPLATGVHDIEPWHQGSVNAFAGEMGVLNNDWNEEIDHEIWLATIAESDPSMGDDPWNEWGTHDKEKDDD